MATKAAAVKSNRLWVGAGGSVTCDAHAGVYLKSAIDNDPTATHHETPLDWWIEYSLREMPCETCSPWMTLVVA